MKIKREVLIFISIALIVSLIISSILYHTLDYTVWFPQHLPPKDIFRFITLFFISFFGLLSLLILSYITDKIQKRKRDRT